MIDVYPYTPRKTNYENLEEFFVARHDLLDEILGSLRKQAKAKSLQHWMILGPRGLGKSHLAALLHHRVKNTPILRKKWVPLLMNEEESEVFSLSTLMARIVVVLAEELREDTPELADEVINYLDQLRRDVKSSEQLFNDLVAYLMDFTKLNKKRLVVFLENTDELFTKSLKSSKEIKIFRNFLLNENIILFIATSPIFFERISKQREPLYGLFRLRHLELLDFDHSMDLMHRWAEQAGNERMLNRLKQPDFRLRVLFHLTGGNPRLLLFLYLTLSSQEEMEHAANIFGQLLEHDLTGFYTLRMRDIPEQEKPIVVALAKSRTNLTQKEISEQTFLPLNSMGTHINRLERAGMVQAFTKKSGKNTLYGLTDHLFRLWHQWRNGWREKEIIQALVEFLAIWYRKRDLASLAEGKGTHALYARQALELRQEEDFKSRLEFVQEEGLTELKERLHQKDYEGVFGLIESFSDLGLELETSIEEIETVMFDKGLAASSLGFLTDLENQFRDQAKESNDEKSKDSALERIKTLQTVAKIADGRPLAKIPVKKFKTSEQAFFIGELRLKRKDFRGAEKAFQRVVDLNPDSPGDWNHLGVARGKQNDHPGAEKAFQRVVELAPSGSRDWLNLGFVQSCQGKFVEAEKSFLRSIELNPEDSNAWRNLGIAQIAQDNYTGAEKAFKSAVNLNPEDSDGWVNLGIARVKQDNNTGAGEAFLSAVNLDPKDLKGWLSLGFIRMAMENDVGGEEAFLRAVNIEPKNSSTWQYLGIARANQENHAGAEEAFSRTVELEPDNSSGWSDLGVARTKQHNNAGAEEAFLRGIDIDPDNSGMWFFLGDTRVSQDNNAGAEEAFLRAVELDPDDSTGWFKLGASRLLQNEYAGAEKAFLRGLEINPDDSSGWFLHGMGLFGQRKLKKAHQAFLKAIQLNAQHIGAYLMLTELNVISKGQFDALGRLDQSLKLRNIEVQVRAFLHFLRALALITDGNKPGARNALKNANKWMNKLDLETQTDQRQSVLGDLMGLLQDSILPKSWKVVESYLSFLAKTVPDVYAVIGRLGYVVEFYKELEFEPRRKAGGRGKATARAQRILDRLPSEERGPVEAIVKEVEENIKNWQED